VRPVYLSGDRLYLRALRKEDAARATAWQPRPTPINEPAAEAYLKERHTAALWPNDPLLLAIVRVEDDEVVGGVEVERPQGRNVRVAVRAAPAMADAAADAIEADALRLLVPWLREEVEAMVVTVPIAADRRESIAAAESLGMVQGTRLRQFVARAGRRVDLLEYEALKPRRGQDGVVAR
jgi:RimJ/RimL family protein N-acetyltransferase